MAEARAAEESAASAESVDLGVAEGEAAQGGAIVVTGQRAEYGARSTRSATRTDTEIRDVPQAMTVISESQIEDQALRSIADVLTYVPGATPGTGESNRDQITLRGNNTTADFFLDGLRDDSQYFRDLYNVDRVEVLRGPNAMIFGRGGGGGVVNRVTKRASGEAWREFALAGDSEGGVRLTGDVDQPLGSGIGLRVNGVWEHGESFRRGVEIDRWGVNTTLGATIGDTRLDFSYEYFHDRRTTDRGVPAFNDRPLEGADRLFFGDPEDSFADVDVHIGSFAVEHRLAEGLTLRNRTQYADYDKAYQNIYPSDLNEASGIVSLSAYRDTARRHNLISQTDLVWRTDTGGVGHTLLFGFELGRQETRSRRFNGFFQPSDSAGFGVLASSPTIDADIVFRPVNTNAARTPANFNETEATIAAIYVQDQIRISDAFEILAGLRFDRFDLDAVNLNNGARFGRTDELVSPRLGLIFRPAPALTLYASYSRSYLPSAGDQFTSLDLTGAALEPERFDNYEVGAKWEPVPGLLATLAVYQLDRTNTRAPGPTPGTIVLTGAQRSRGIEIGLERNVTDRWQVSAGYALQEAEISRTTAAAPAGRAVPLVPRHQFSMWNRYEVAERLGLGLGLVARSRMYTSISNAVTLPGYARLDAAAFFELSEGIEAQLNLENVTGADYFATAHNDNNIAPGAPRTLRGTVRFRF
ncbi:MAG TPA: TonB-dependent siderophore receptor [Allosphingosinicella sp.]|nr:TonB-dependent siderophore receptor [Allosphingosinicella sp.]HYG31205.1 TonB-dependent siderophore receptor [Allosphingosinicella sp.]